MRFVLVPAIILIGVYMLKRASKPELKHFSASEFGVWYPLMSNELLIKLDTLRDLLGSPVFISPVSGGIGRHGGGSSQHNVDKWGEVRAVDVFAKIGGEFVTTQSQRQRLYDAARQAGFTGIGIYTDTIYNSAPANLLHVDVRQDKTPNAPALWSRVNGQYSGLTEVVAYV
jgi:hypothetical protein